MQEAEDGVTSTLFGKSGEAEITSRPSSMADQCEAEVNIQQSRPAGNEFQYLPPPPSLTQLVRPVSAPPAGSQKTPPNLSEISLDQSQHDQIKKRPSTSRGYRTDRGQYSRGASSGIKQAIVSPLVSTNNTVTTMSSGKFDPSTDTEEDLDDDTMPLEEAETILTSGLSNMEIVTPPSSMATLESPSTSSRVQPQRQAESALSQKSRRSSSSEKKVNFSLTLGSAGLSEIPEITEPVVTEPQVNTMVSNIIQIAKEQCEADLVFNQVNDDEADTVASPGEEVTYTIDDKGDHPSTPITNKEAIPQGTTDDGVIPQISAEVLGEAIATSQLVTKRSSRLSASKSDSKASMIKKGSKLDTQKPGKGASPTKKLVQKPDIKQSPGSKAKKNAVQPSKKKLDSQWKQAILKGMKK